MRDNFVFYTQAYGKQWFMCIDCGHKEPHKPLVCPVCKNKPENKELQQAARQAIEGMISGRMKK